MPYASQFSLFASLAVLAVCMKIKAGCILVCLQAVENPDYKRELAECLVVGYKAD